MTTRLMQRFLLVLPIIFVLSCSTALAQLPQIRLKSVFPQGGQRGKNIGLVITGTDLDEVTELVFSSPNLTATPYLDSKEQPVANKFTINIAPEAEPGLYDIRARGLFGLSNPRIFRIGAIAETQEKEPNDTEETAQQIPINTVINARSGSAADVDVFTVNAKTDQTIVFRSEAALVDSLMQPVLELFDADGRRVAHSRRKRQQEAVIVYTSPNDQALLLKVHDTVYASGNEYGYRLSIDTQPQVDFISPAVLPFNTETEVTLFGRHLPDGKVTQQMIDGAPLLQKRIRIKIDGTMRHFVGADSSAAAIDRILYSGVPGNLLPVVLNSHDSLHQPEATPKDKTQVAQTIKLPANVSASFSEPMEEDVYRFVAKKGEQWQIEVLADRLGSIADPLLIVEHITTDATGQETKKRLAREETNKQNPGGNKLPTLTTDPSFTLKIPADGTYQIRLKDRYAASRGHAGLTYTLSVQPSVPDFRVVLFDSFPSADGKAPPGTGAISIRKGGTYQVPVYAYRHGGHNEAIHIVTKGIPSGVKLSKATIPAGQNSTELIITAAGDAPDGIGVVNLIAIAEKSEIVRNVKIATLVHEGSNGLPRTGRVTSSLMLSVMKDEEPIHIEPQISEVAVSQGQQLLVPIQLVRKSGFTDKVSVAFSGQPKNVDVPTVAIPKDSDSAIARFYFKDNAPVGSATLMMSATAEVLYVRNPWQLEKAKAAVAATKAKVESETKAEADSKALVEASKKKVIELAEVLKVYGADINTKMAELSDVRAAIKQTLSGKTNAIKSLVQLQNPTQLAAAVDQSTGSNLDNAIGAIEVSTAATRQAAKPMLQLLKQIEDLTAQITSKQKLIADKNKEIAAAKQTIATQQVVNTDAGRSLRKSTTLLKRLAAELKTSEEAATKAATAAKPQKKNVRVVAIPIQITVHATPGKLTAAVPDGGAIKKGASVDVKVTLARKNKFTGPVNVSLELPKSDSRITSNTVGIPADQTEAIVKITAAADAAAGDVAFAVIRATANVGDRTASFDAPVALKITE